MKKILNIILISLLIFSCSSNKKEIILFPESNFKKEIDGKEIKLFTLKNNNGITAQITNFGGRVVSLWVPDSNGHFEDIVLGYENIDGYLKSKEKYYGAIIGRYANRIANGKFLLEGKEHSLNSTGKTHSHGGKKGFSHVVWNASQIDEQTLELTYESPNMDQGFPGTLKTKVVYSLTAANELKVEYWAVTDKPTIINLTNHSFFNLHGAGSGSTNDHILQINADSFTVVKKGLIPTGEIAPVNGTPLDFTEPTAIGERYENDFEQLKLGSGYDHNYVLNKSNNLITKAAEVIDPISGRIMEVFTNEPGMHLYGGNFLDGSDVGKFDKKYESRSAYCFETQHFPDSPNHPNFPSTVLKPGEEYYSICIYKFSTK